jgi:hypothetical protein
VIAINLIICLSLPIGYESGPAPSYPNNLHKGGEDTGPNQSGR